MTVSLEELTPHVGENVVLSITPADGGEATDIEGKLEVASDAGVGFKPKRKRDIELLELSQIVGVKAAPAASGALKQKKLSPVTVATVRGHLIDRHGAPLSQVNGMSNEDALELHGKIDHSDLGHNHDKVSADEAAAAANASDSEDSASE